VLGISKQSDVIVDDQSKVSRYCRSSNSNNWLIFDFFYISEAKKMSDNLNMNNAKPLDIMESNDNTSGSWLPVQESITQRVNKYIL
jgi:hypothetical protein